MTEGAKRWAAAGLIGVAAVAVLAGCSRNETQRVNRELRWDDRPARVTCYGYGRLMIDTVSMGAVERDEDGIVSFIDSRTGRPVKAEGECVIEHLQAAVTPNPALTAGLSPLAEGAAPPAPAPTAKE